MKLSIITINRNNASGLEKTIKSVIDQTNKDFEYIVIDGNSTDGSVEIINKYSFGINYWVSESDTGVYSAMNKGIRKAQGEYCLFLNSGDHLVSTTTLQNVFDETSKNNISADIFYSDCILSSGKIRIYPDNMTINNYFKTGINHQNSLIKLSLFKEHGFYNEEFRIFSDVEFFLREMWIYKSKFNKIKTNISVFDINGIGSRLSPEIYDERIICFNKIFHELSETMMDVADYYNSVYYSIINNYGYTKFLNLCLRIYKFIVSRTQKIFRIFRKS